MPKNKNQQRDEEEDDVDMDNEELDLGDEDQGEGEEGADEADGSREQEDLDPEEATQQKRNMRAKYRQLHQEVEGTRQNLIDTSVEDMSKQVEQANLLFKDVQAPSEAILDSRVLMAASDAGALKARQLKLDANAFDTDDFITKLQRFLGGRFGAGRARGARAASAESDEDEEEEQFDRWLKVGRALAPHSLRVPAAEHMWGPLSTELKERKAGNRRQHQKPDESQRVRPEELESNDINKDPQETTKMVKMINTLLQSDDVPPEGIAYLRFIVNPDSFSQTVENMFYFAFLVKDGKAAILADEEPDSPLYGEMTCYACEGPMQQDAIEAGGKKQQHVFELTEDVWREAIEAYDITTSMIPTREVPDAHKKKTGRWN